MFQEKDSKGYIDHELREIDRNTKRYRENIYKEKTINIRNLDEGISCHWLNCVPHLLKLITLKKIFLE